MANDQVEAMPMTERRSGESVPRGRPVYGSEPSYSSEASQVTREKGSKAKKHCFFISKASIICLILVAGALLGYHYYFHSNEEAAEAISVSAYFPYSPQVNVPLATVIAGKWTPCHQELYSNALNGTQIANIRMKCYKQKVMVGCKRVGSNHLTVAAWGRKTTVFGVTEERSPSRGDCKYKEEAGTKWYRAPKAWGFAAYNNSLYLHTADVGDTKGPAQHRDSGTTRICFFINLRVFGGYRCGKIINLEQSNKWEKVFYHTN